MKPLTLQEIEYLAHKVAKELMDFDEPLPAFATRYPGVLESCLAQPFQSFGTEELYPGLIDKAVALFYFITKNHPFENGNKRMAVTTMLLFLYKNGQWLQIDPDDLYKIAMTVANSKPKEKDKITALLIDAFGKYVTKR